MNGLKTREDLLNLISEYELKNKKYYIKSFIVKNEDIFFQLAWLILAIVLTFYGSFSYSSSNGLFLFIGCSLSLFMMILTAFGIFYKKEFYYDHFKELKNAFFVGDMILNNESGMIFKIIDVDFEKDNFTIESGKIYNSSEKNLFNRIQEISLD